MSGDNVIVELLTQIRDNQRISLERQEELLLISREQIERSKRQIEESIELQRQAVARQKSIGRVVLPVLVVCAALLVFSML